MTVYDQVVSLVTLYNQGVASSSVPGEAFNILYTYPLVFLFSVGLFFASGEFLFQKSDQRSILKCMSVFVIAFLIASPFVYLYITCGCNGTAIYRRTGTAGKICGANGLKEISLRPLFDGSIKFEEPYYETTEIIRVIDSLISHNIKESVMKSVVTTTAPQEKVTLPYTDPPLRSLVK